MLPVRLASQVHGQAKNTTPIHVKPPGSRLQRSASFHPVLQLCRHDAHGRRQARAAIWPHWPAGYKAAQEWQAPEVSPTITIPIAQKFLAYCYYGILQSSVYVQIAVKPCVRGISMDQSPANSQPYIRVSPAIAMLDTPLQIQLAAFPPHCAVVLHMSMRDMLGRLWRAHATFLTDAEGTIDVQHQAPIAGTYTGIDPMGLIWSMTLDSAADVIAQPEQGVLPPVRMLLTAEIDGQTACETTFDRFILAPTIQRKVIGGMGLVGTFFAPIAGGSYPGIVLLGGSEGGLHEEDAALLAAHGFAVLALAYFGIPGVSPVLADIPLEYFGTAIAWLQRQAQVRDDRLGVIGGSRGGEAALLIGATFPDIRAVVSLVGSGVMTQSIGRGSLLECLRHPVPSSWTDKGQSLPFLPYTVTPELERQISAGEPVELRQVFLPGLTNHAAVAAATIPVEQIQGATLLISAGDDRSWPSVALSEIAMSRFAQHQHPHPYRHITYQKAGHLIAPPPYGPTTDTMVPGPGVTFIMGGTPQDNAAARADAWVQSIRFFAEQLS